MKKQLKGLVKAITPKAIKINDQWLTITQKSLFNGEQLLKETDLEAIKGAYVEANCTDHWIDNLIVLNPPQNGPDISLPPKTTKKYNQISEQNYNSLRWTIIKTLIENGRTTDEAIEECRKILQFLYDK